MRDRVAFVHVAKCAGTSLTAALSAHFDAAEVAPWWLGRDIFGGFARLDEIQRPVFDGDAADLRAYRFLHGHWSVPEVGAAFDDADVLVLLREPRTRFLSHFSYWRSWSEEEHLMWEPYDASRVACRPLEAFASEPSVAHQTDNLICRTILGDDPRIPLDGFIRPRDLPAVAEDTARRLDALGFVDVLERGPDMQRSLEEWLGAPLVLEHRNRTEIERTDGIDLAAPGVQQLLNERNAADVQVWEHVARRRGMDPLAARTRADTEYGATVARVAAHAGTSASPASIEAPSNDTDTALRRPFGRLRRRWSTASWR